MIGSPCPFCHEPRTALHFCKPYTPPPGSIRAFARYAGITVKQAVYWREQGLHYHGHTYRLRDYTSLALRRFIRQVPNHLSMRSVKPEIYHAALDTQPGEVEIPRRCQVPPTPRGMR